MRKDGGSWITGTERKHFLSFCRLLPLLQGAGVCFLRSNGELGKYSREKSLIKENYTRNQRGSFRIGPMLTRSGYVNVIKHNSTSSVHIASLAKRM